MTTPAERSWIIREYRPDDARAVRACIVELQEAERAIEPRLRPGEDITLLAGNDTARRLYRRAGFTPHLEVLAKRLS